MTTRTNIAPAPAPAPALVPASLPTARPRNAALVGMAGVEARRQSEWVSPGEFMCEILQASEGTTRKGRPFAVVELKVLEAAPSARPAQPALAIQAGRTMSHMIMLDLDGAARNVRSFLDAVASPREAADLNNPDTADGVVAALLAGPASSATGRFVQVSAFNVPTKRGTSFTVVQYFRPIETASE